jgi:hypothetical protein
MDLISNVQANANAALPQQCAPKNANQPVGNGGNAPASHNVQVVQAPAQIVQAPAQVVEEKCFIDRLLEDIKLVGLANIAAGIVGIYVAKENYISRFAGALMAFLSPGGVSVLEHLACMLPLLPNESKFFTGIAMSFLAGVVGSNNYREFAVGYLLSKCAGILLGCVCQFAFNCVSMVSERGMWWCIKEMFRGCLNLWLNAYPSYLPQLAQFSSGDPKPLLRSRCTSVNY